MAEALGMMSFFAETPSACSNDSHNYICINDLHVISTVIAYVLFNSRACAKHHNGRPLMSNTEMHMLLYWSTDK